MGDANQHPVAGRDSDHEGSARDSAHTKIFAEVEERDIASICGWCANLNVLKLDREEGDQIVIYWRALKIGVLDVRIQRNGFDLAVSHGICESCRQRHFPPLRDTTAQRGER